MVRDETFLDETFLDEIFQIDNYLKFEKAVKILNSFEWIGSFFLFLSTEFFTRVLGFKAEQSIRKFFKAKLFFIQCFCMKS